MSEAKPIFVIERGRFHHVFGFVSAILVGVVFFTGALALLLLITFPATPRAQMREQAMILGNVLVFLVGCIAVVYWTENRIGRVELYLDHVAIRTLPTASPSAYLKWEDASGYHDHASNYVRVLPRPSLLGFLYTVKIPTRTDAERTQVLAFLDARGLARLAP